MSQSSLGKFRYVLRPAKNIERKMFCQTFATLSCIAPLTTYRYIGFGSIEFVDFILFHRQLGIEDMVSIESKKDEAERVKFNIPYSCIKMRWGMSNDILPTLEWSKKTIIWLDYDMHLNNSILNDIRLVSSCLKSGSVLIITVDVEPEDVAGVQNIQKKRLDDLEKNVGSDKVPVDVRGNDLANWGLSRVCRRIIDNEINLSLMDRNAPIPESSQIQYIQLFNIHYADGARMLTVGGILLDSDDQKKFSNTQLKGLDFISHDENEYLIETPMLTLRELRSIDNFLPSTKIKVPKGIPPESCEKYRKVYRYFPTFGEIEAW